MTLHEKINLKFDEFLLLTDVEEKKQAKDTIELLIFALAPHEVDAHTYYLWGKIYYWQDEGKPQNTEMALSKFQASVELDATHYMAMLYTAHCFHDLGNYAEALHHYQQVNQERLKTDYPIWRYIKLREQIGFCLFQTGQPIEAESYFQEVLEWSQQLKSDQIASPYELLCCLPVDHPIVVAIKQSKGYW